MNDYLTDSFAWSFVGLVAGYGLAKIELRVKRTIRHWRHHDHT